MLFFSKRWYSKIYQRMFPDEFQIDVTFTDDWRTLFINALSDSIETSNSITTKMLPFPANFIADLGNEFFRMFRILQPLLKKNEREFNILDRILKELKDLLSEHKIKIVDLSGEIYQKERNDFEALGKKDDANNIDTMIIECCERPAIFLNNYLVQKARGTVTNTKPQTKIEKKHIFFLNTFYQLSLLWLVPSAFRFNSVNVKKDWIEEISLSIATYASKIFKTKVEVKSPTTLENCPSEFIISLCNLYFRLNRNLKFFGTEAQQSLQRILKNIDKYVLQKFHIQSIDLTSQVYDPALIYFEPIALPKKIKGLNFPQIESCECPAILLKGKLLQKAKGLVVLPE